MTGIVDEGTFNGNVVSCAAGLAALRQMGDGKIASLTARASRLGESVTRGVQPHIPPGRGDRVGDGGGPVKAM